MNQKKRANRITRSFQRETKSMRWRTRRLEKIVRDSKVPDVPGAEQSTYLTKVV